MEVLCLGKLFVTVWGQANITTSHYAQSIYVRGSLESKALYLALFPTADYASHDTGAWPKPIFSIWSLGQRSTSSGSWMSPFYMKTGVPSVKKAHLFFLFEESFSLLSSWLNVLIDME
jgi:hypothetical protein